MHNGCMVNGLLCTRSGSVEKLHQGGVDRSQLQFSCPHFLGFPPRSLPWQLPHLGRSVNDENSAFAALGIISFVSETIIGVLF